MVCFTLQVKEAGNSLWSMKNDFFLKKRKHFSSSSYTLAFHEIPYITLCGKDGLFGVLILKLETYFVIKKNDNEVANFNLINYC